MQNWEMLLTAAGLGGGSGVLTKKLTDKQQDNRIKANEELIKSNYQKIRALQQSHIEIKGQIDMNTALDKEFRQTFKEHKDAIHQDLADIKQSLAMLTSHLLRK